MSVIAITNQKGGVGKTTFAFNLSKGLASRGHRVLVVDNDPQGNLTSAFLEDPTALEANVLDFYEGRVGSVQPQTVGQGLELIGANIHLSRIAESEFEVIFRLKEGLEGLKGSYDFVLIDCLPSFGYLNMAALNAADRVLIPTKPAPFALAGLKDLFDTVSKVQRRLNADLKVLGIVLNLVEGRRTTLGGELEGVLRETYGDLVFETSIHKGVKLEESPSFNQSVMEYDPGGKPAQQLEALLGEMLSRLGK